MPGDQVLVIMPAERGGPEVRKIPGFVTRVDHDGVLADLKFDGSRNDQELHSAPYDPTGSKPNSWCFPDDVK